MTVKTIAMLPFIMTLLWCSPLSAHKLNVFVWVDGNDVIVESSLSGGRTLVHGTVTVINSESDQTVITGQSDSNGTFSFTLPEEIRNQGPTLDIIVNGGDGHKSHWLLQPEDYGSAVKQPSSQPEPERRLPSQHNNNTGDNCLSRDDFEKILEQNLDQKLTPLRKNLASLVNHSPTLRDILGGIGYLIGFAGIAAWLRSRKHKNL